MTKDKDLKRLARERSAQTGESYSTARRQLVEKRPGPTDADGPNDLMRPWLGLDSAAMVAAPLAHDEARIAGHPWVEPEHLLLGLLSHGAVLPALHEMRVSPVALRHHVERWLPPKRAARVNPTLSSTFLWTLALGREEAASRGATAASPHDVLVALTRIERPVRDILAEFGASERRVREHLGYEDPTMESTVRAAILNRLLPLLGHSVAHIAGVVRDVQIDVGNDRAAVNLVSEQPAVLVRLADDIRLAAETALGTSTINVTVAAPAFPT